MALRHVVSAREVLSFMPRVTVNRLRMDMPVNYDKLCKAIAVAETSGCTDGTAIKRKNCHGIMAWDKDGNRFPRYFKSHDDSQKMCIEIWKRSYKKFPDIALAKKWTGNDKSNTWLSIVTQKYYSL